ncbi:WavE lipopolysaccharide synthesis family protein [Scandinavium goeteborgense]|uniref:WavE lipopolysaccharide synthesis family protein n=1 Tax=Scandinavium goeteborgense TaxID=1851514 RepID=UPI000F674B46|nr:WavE lipopolysaccharide synthesis family protein [Scandinavium goeteborgense]QKN79783.1 hypothetical protein A8O29_000150 [Scandinavium goeteborgense]
MKDLSIIFQGPVEMKNGSFNQFLDYLARTRRTFPASEIILSTWEMLPIEKDMILNHLSLLGIRIIHSSDPGPLIGKDEAGEYLCNINRLLVSSHAGLAAATRPLALKLRTDTYISSRKLINLLEKHVLIENELKRDLDYQVFSKRVINASWFSRDARGSLPYLFHPGDILLAGKTEDVRLFFSAPLATKALFKPVSAPGLWSAWRYVPEQWFWVHAIGKVTNRKVYEGSLRSSPKLVTLSEKYYLANFISYSPSKLGFHWPKYWKRYPFRGLFSLYTQRRWLRLYKYYHGGGPNFSVGKWLDWAVTKLWRTGYLIRAMLQRNKLIRCLALTLFLHRK